MNNRIAIIGAGVAGLTAAGVLAGRGYHVTVIEQSDAAGGNVRNWDRLFPNLRNAAEVLKPLLCDGKPQFKILVNTTVVAITRDTCFRLKLSDGKFAVVDAILLSTGFGIFYAHRKEEYGYGIYDNVITSVDLEKMMAGGKRVLTSDGKAPARVAFVHCVGSRDEKVGNTYCSKVCCATAVKQAMEIKEMYPDAEIFCLYMDLRMYDRYFEDMYRRAQEKYGITFIRGRLSEAAESIDGRIQIKTEDTLAGRPIKMQVDMLVLMTGMEPAMQNREYTNMLGVIRGNDGFFVSEDEHLIFNQSSTKGVFLAGACKGPKNITETIADARSAANAIDDWLKIESMRNTQR